MIAVCVACICGGIAVGLAIAYTCERSKVGGLRRDIEAVQGQADRTDRELERTDLYLFGEDGDEETGESCVEHSLTELENRNDAVEAVAHDARRIARQCEERQKEDINRYATLAAFCSLVDEVEALKGQIAGMPISREVLTEPEFKPTRFSPSREWLLKMAEHEDRHPCFTIGSLPEAIETLKAAEHFEAAHASTDFDLTGPREDDQPTDVQAIDERFASLSCGLESEPILPHIQGRVDKVLTARGFK